MPRVALVALALVLAAPFAAAATGVKVLGGFYDPGSIDVLVGEEVTWTNDDAMPHTVTSSWDEGATFDAPLKNGESYTTSFAEPGTYTVHCKPHAYFDEETGKWEGMVMTVQVLPLETGAGIAAPLKGTPGFGAAFAALAFVGLALLVGRRKA